MILGIFSIWICLHMLNTWLIRLFFNVFVFVLVDISTYVCVCVTVCIELTSKICELTLNESRIIYVYSASVFFGLNSISELFEIFRKIEIDFCTCGRPEFCVWVFVCVFVFVFVYKTVKSGNHFSYRQSLIMPLLCHSFFFLTETELS